MRRNPLCVRTAVLAAVLSCPSRPLDAQQSALVAGAGSRSVACRSYDAGRWRIVETKNFRVCTLHRHLPLEALPALCEHLKTQIAANLFNDEDIQGGWRPRCDVIVHATLRDYQTALVNGADNSVGCTTIDVDGGRVVSRRIDIRVDADNWQNDALPHELTHVILSDRYQGRRLPPWLDEGLGVLSESARKRQLRAAAFEAARQRRTIYSPSQLLTLRQFPQPEYRDAFYVQSAALVHGLMAIRGSAAFEDFIERTLDSGSEAALRQVFGIKDVSELDRFVRDRGVTHRLCEGGSLPGDVTFVVRDGG